MRRNPARLQEEGGATLVIVGLALVVVLGMVVLTVDLGGLLVMKRRLVTSADAGALAAAEACALQEGLASADAYASTDPGLTGHIPRQNLDDSSLVRVQFDITDCDAGSGEVAVTYQATQPLYFAPAIGLDTAEDVQAAAVAYWGAAGGGAGSVPVMLGAGQLRDQCGFPDVEIGDECSFWYDNDDLGSGEWGVMNLDTWGIAPSVGQCPASGAADRREYIENGYPELLHLAEIPTYVCVDTGVATDAQALDSEAGQMKLFPVNDEDQQVTSSGSLCPPPDCTPHKYAIVGFAQLLIVDVLRGNDASVGDNPGTNGSCSADRDFTQASPGNTWDLTTQSCDISNLRYPGDPSRPYPRLTKKVGPVTTEFVEGTDFTYDAGTSVITWIRTEDVPGVKVEWDWSLPPTSNPYCPGHPQDPNARCLVVEWNGITTSGGGPCEGCDDFGVRAVGLRA